METIIQNWLEQGKVNAQKKAVEMAKLELNCWTNEFEQQLIKYDHFTAKQVQERKRNLIKASQGIF